MALNGLQTGLMAVAGVIGAAALVLTNTNLLFEEVGKTRNSIESDDPRYKECSHPSFGVDSWGSNSMVNDSTRWMTGPYSSDQLCADLKHKEINSRGLTGSAHETVIVRKDKNQRKGANGQTETKYFCEIEISSNPIYNKKRDKECGDQ